MCSCVQHTVIFCGVVYKATLESLVLSEATLTCAAAAAACRIKTKRTKIKEGWEEWVGKSSVCFLFRPAILLCKELKPFWKKNLWKSWKVVYYLYFYRIFIDLWALWGDLKRRKIQCSFKWYACLAYSQNTYGYHLRIRIRIKYCVYYLIVHFFNRHSPASSKKSRENDWRE